MKPVNGKNLFIHMRLGQCISHDRLHYGYAASLYVSEIVTDAQLGVCLLGACGMNGAFSPLNL